MQNQTDTRDVPLQKAGVRGLRYPIRVLDRAKKFQMTTATADLFVNLPRRYKGTHMSRFIEIFHAYHGDLSMKRFLAMLEEIRTKLDAEQSFGTVSFPFFTEKKAPVSGQAGFMECTCTYDGVVSAPHENAAPHSLEENASHVRSGNSKFFVSVEIPVTTLCPCSKAISEAGAHNQRGVVKVKVRNTCFFWIEDIIALVESCASSPVYPLLKREDEKYVTEHAYNNPRFAEDVVREVYLGLKKFPELFGIEKPFIWFSVEAENFESIHAHNAYAYAEFDGNAAERTARRIENNGK